MVRILLSSLLISLCNAADGQNSDVAQDIINTLIAQTKSTPEAPCFEADTDYWGFDVGGVPYTASARECQRACAKDESVPIKCKFWTWNKGSKTCGFKSDNSELRYDTVAESGPREGCENAEQKDAGSKPPILPTEMGKPAVVLQKRQILEDTPTPEEPTKEEHSAMMDKAENDENFADALKQFANLEKEEIARGEEKNVNAAPSRQR